MTKYQAQNFTAAGCHFSVRHVLRFAAPTEARPVPCLSTSRRWRELALKLLAAGLLWGGTQSAQAETIVIQPTSDRYAWDTNMNGTFDTLFDESTTQLFANDNFEIVGEYRFALEFDLSALPGDRPIDSAILSITNGSRRGGTTLQVHGYTGNGAVELTDMAVSNLLADVPGAFPSPLTIDISAFVQSQIASGSPFAGIMVKTQNGGSAGFVSKEGFFPPTLAVNLASVPLPGSAILFAWGLSGLLAYGRRQPRDVSAETA